MPRDITDEDSGQTHIGAGLTSEKNLEAAYIRTVEGLKRLKNMPTITQEDYEAGVQINAQRLGISEERLKEEVNRLISQDESTNNNPSPNVEPPQK